MPYIGNPIYQSAFVTDQFSGNGSTTAFTMSVAPAGTSNVLVAVSGVLQDPSTYGVVGNTLTFTAAPPSGTGNISCRYLGVPVTGVTTTAYRTKTEFTATAGQTTFTPPSYTAGYIDVFRNGVLLGSADYTASNGTTVVLTTGATAGDLITTESFYVSSVLNAIPNTPASVGTSNIQSSVTLTTPTIDKINTSVTNVSLGAGNASIMKNRIINGAMVIDQRNAGASTTPTNTSAQVYCLDRWATYGSVASKFSVQQNAGSVTPPAGFTNYLGITSLSAYSPAAGDQIFLQQYIEGYNVADLAWGTANAQTITLSFWVRSSLTGTFGGALENSSGTRSYAFSYTISSASTWTQISITIPGDTTGTWLTTNGTGVQCYWNLGNGTTYSKAAGSWGSGNVQNATGSVSVVGTNGATFYITGVQLEVGSSQTGYEYRNYQQELALCQRYFWIKRNISAAGNQLIGNLTAYNGTHTWGKWLDLPVQQRTAGTTAWSAYSDFGCYDAGGSNTFACTAGNLPSSDGQNIYSFGSLTHGTASFSAGQSLVFCFVSASGTGYISCSAEL